MPTYRGARIGRRPSIVIMVDERAMNQSSIFMPSDLYAGPQHKTPALSNAGSLMPSSRP